MRIVRGVPSEPLTPRGKPHPSRNPSRANSSAAVGDCSTGCLPRRLPSPLRPLAACRRELPSRGLTTCCPASVASVAKRRSVPRANLSALAAPVGPFLGNRPDCSLCRRDRFHFESVIRLGVYEGRLREMCLAAKRPGCEELAAATRRNPVCRRRTGPLGGPGGGDCSVPHHWSEAFLGPPKTPETLASVLSRRLRVRMATSILAKSRRTLKQASLPSTRRRVNLRTAFRVPGRFASQVAGRRILLVDDVLTTGATADKARASTARCGGRVRPSGGDRPLCRAQAGRRTRRHKSLITWKSLLPRIRSTQASLSKSRLPRPKKQRRRSSSSKGWRSSCPRS